MNSEFGEFGRDCVGRDCVGPRLLAVRFHSDTIEQTRMSRVPHDSTELEKIYGRRFDAHILYRDRIWKQLTSEFFSKYISSEDRLLDLGCGYGEFINNIRCARKFAMDLNARARERLSVHGFTVEESIDRFLPYTMVNRRHFPAILVSTYLALPVIWKVFGKQFLVVGRK